MTNAVASAPPAEERAKKVPGRPFQPGTSGNPKGRPPGVARAARKLIGKNGEKALAFLNDLMTGKVQTVEIAEPDGTTRVEAQLPPIKERRLAAEALLDRAVGKTTQPLEVGGAGGGPLRAIVTINGIVTKGGQE